MRTPFYLKIVLLVAMVSSLGCERCSPPEETLHISPVTIQNGDIVLLSTIGDSIEAVVLEASPNSLIGKVGIVRVSERNILVYDNLSRSVLVFSRAGQFRFKLAIKESTKLNGLFDARINGDESFSLLLLNYDVSQKVVFNETGELISQFQLPVALSFWDCPSGTILFFPPPLNRDHKRSLFFTYGSNMHVLEDQGAGFYRYQKYPKEVKFFSTAYSKDNFCFFESVTSRVYYFDNGGGLARTLKIEADASLLIPEDDFFAEINSVKSYLNYFHIAEYYEYGDWIMLTASLERRYTPLLVNRKTFGVKRLLKVDEASKGFGFIDDLNGRQPFWPKGSTNSGNLFSYIEDAKQLRNILVPHGTRGHYDSVEGINDHTILLNPIILILH